MIPSSPWSQAMRRRTSPSVSILGQSKGVFAACRHQPFQKMASRGEFGSSEVVAVGWKLSID